MYESMRKMILESRKPDGASYLAGLGLTFSVTLRPEEGGASHDLMEGGGATPVTPSNVYKYVREYALLRMIVINQEPLQVSSWLFYGGLIIRTNWSLNHLHLSTVSIVD